MTQNYKHGKIFFAGLLFYVCVSFPAATSAQALYDSGPAMLDSGPVDGGAGLYDGGPSLYDSGSGQVFVPGLYDNGSGELPVSGLYDSGNEVSNPRLYDSGAGLYDSGAAGGLSLPPGLYDSGSASYPPPQLYDSGSDYLGRPQLYDSGSIGGDVIVSPYVGPAYDPYTGIGGSYGSAFGGSSYYGSSYYSGSYTSGGYGYGYYGAPYISGNMMSAGYMPSYSTSYAPTYGAMYAASYMPSYAPTYAAQTYAAPSYASYQQPIAARSYGTTQSYASAPLVTTPSYQYQQTAPGVATYGSQSWAQPNQNKNNPAPASPCDSYTLMLDPRVVAAYLAVYPNVHRAELENTQSCGGYMGDLARMRTI